MMMMKRMIMMMMKRRRKTQKKRKRLIFLNKAQVNADGKLFNLESNNAPPLQQRT